MSIDDFKGLMDAFEPAALLPEIGPLFEKFASLARVIVMVGPVVMLLMGLVFLFATPKEANYYIGYRCYYGMGSVEAWRFTQRLAGMVLGGLGLILTVVMLIVCASFRGMEIMPMAEKAVVALIWQAGLSLAACLGINITATVLFNVAGERRRK